MAGSLEYPVKISYRREKRQLREEKNRENSQQPSSAYLSSPARLYSTVLQTMAPHVHALTKTRKIPTDRPSEAIDESSIISNTLKEEIGRSQEVLLGRITQLEEKCNAVHEQQAALRWTIETQIVPYMCTMSELLVDVCEQLGTAKVIKLTDQQQTKIIVFVIHQLLPKHQILFRWSHAAFLRLIGKQPANSQLLSRSTASSLLLSILLLLLFNEFRRIWVLPFEWNWDTINNCWRRGSSVCMAEVWLSTCDCKINPSRMVYVNYTLQSYSQMVDQAWKSEHWAKCFLSPALQHQQSPNACRRSYRLHFCLLSGHLGTHWTSLQRWRQLSTCFSLQVSIHHLLSTRFK